MRFATKSRLAKLAGICQLAFFCTEGDTHPTDAGYAVLAHLLFDASDYGRLRHHH